MASNYNDQLGSRLSGSSWRPSSGPYDTPLDSNGGNRGGNGNSNTNSMMRMNSNDPTPNSLTENTSNRVHFSRAEYKAPNSYQNSLEGSYGQYHHYGKTPSSAVAADGDEGHTNIAHNTGFRESKSYVERYRDIKQKSSMASSTSTTPSPNRRTTTAAAAARSQSTGRMTRDISHQHSSSAAARESSSIRSTSPPVARHELRRYNDDDMSERTPLERWESRKERKMMEKSSNNTSSLSSGRSTRKYHAPPSSSSSSKSRSTSGINSASSRSSTRLSPSPRNISSPERASRSVIRDRATRWSPREEDEEEEVEVYERDDEYGRRDGGYEEYDDFGATRRSQQHDDHSKDRHGTDRRERTSRDRSSDRYHEKSYAQVRQSDSRSGSGSGYGKGSTSRHHHKEDHQDGRHRDDSRRSDPLGHRHSSLYESNGDSTRDNNNDNDVGNSSPLYDDADEEGAGNIQVGEQSPLAIDHHFEGDRGKRQMRSSPRSSPQRGTPPRGSPGRSTTSSSSHRSAPQRSTPQRSNVMASTPSPNRPSPGRAKSTYVDDLASFCESVTSSVAASRNVNQGNVTSHPPQPLPGVLRNGQKSQQTATTATAAAMRSLDGVQYSEMEAGTNNNNNNNNTGTHDDSNRAGVIVQEAMPHHDPVSPVSYADQSSRGGGETRVRHRASDMCKHFTGQDCTPKNKGRKKCFLIALAVCLTFIIGAFVAVYFIGEWQEEDDNNEGVDSDQDDKFERGDQQGMTGWDVPTSADPNAPLPPATSLPFTPTSTPTGTTTTNPTGTPTAKPTNERERSIGDFVSSLSKGESNKSGSPQHRAKMWLVNEDEMNLHLPHNDDGSYTSSYSEGAASNFASFYGSVSQPASWESAVADRIKQRFALATLYYSMGVGDGGVVKGWLQGDECQFVGDYDRAWDGVDCDDNGLVRALALDGANLHGTIPAEISLLSSLENLIIKNNPGLIGKIPHSIGQLIQLRQFGLYSNHLTGTVPKNIFRLNHLVYLNLSENGLTGTIPWEEISHQQKKLQRLVLHNNYLDGSIDFHKLAKAGSISLLSLSNNMFDGYIDSVGGLSSLEYLYLDGNKLVGSIPVAIGNLVNLKAFNLDENQMYGTLPHSIGNMTDLEYFSAKGNTISGGLPATMKSLTRLTTLNLASNAMSGHLNHLVHISNLKNVHLYSNSFSGTIDGRIFTALPNLEVLFLSSNSLGGSIPSEVAGAQKQLKGLYLSDNNLHGGIPEEVCALYKLEDLFLDANSLGGTLPSCLGSMSSLRRFYVFKNKFKSHVPAGLINLPHLVGLGIEENGVSGGMDQTCAPLKRKSMSIWADCNELDGGCDCCERCCTDQMSSC